MQFSFVHCLLCIVVVSNAFDVPQKDTTDGHFVSEGIESVVEALRKRIIEDGLDPLIIKRRQYEYALDSFFHINGLIEDLQFTGLSNFITNSLNFSMVTYKFNFDLSLPELYLSIRNSSINAVLSNNKYGAAYSGSLILKEIRLAGQLGVSVEKTTGVNIQDLTLDFSLGGIEANVQLNIQGEDLSEKANKALNILIPNYLQQHRNKINRILENISWQYILQTM